MSLMSKLHGFIVNRPGANVSAMVLNYPDYPRQVIQRAVSRLFLAGYLNREGVKGNYSYFINDTRQIAGELPVEDSLKAKELIKTAEILESKRLYNRAATAWFDAFTASFVISEREHCLKRRRACIRRASRITSGEPTYDLPGRFEGEV